MTGPLSCPSAQPDDDAVVIGIVGLTDGHRQATLLRRHVPVATVAHLIPDTVPLTEVLRLAAPCAERRCGHFAEGGCSLAARIVARLPEVAARLPPCGLRSSCRWWHQEGAAACRRCPQITTAPLHASDLLRAVAAPSARLARPRSTSVGDVAHAG